MGGNYMVTCRCYYMIFTVTVKYILNQAKKKGFKNEKLSEVL